MNDTLSRVVAHAMEILGGLPGAEADDLVRTFAREVAARRPGAIVETDRGVVRYSPDDRFPDEPWELLPDEWPRYARRELGAIYDVRPDVPADLLSGGTS